MLPAICLFVITYVLMLIFERYRPYIALFSGIVFVFTGMLPAQQILEEIDFNVLLMIAGMMGMVFLLIESRMPSFLADLVIHKVPNVQMAAVALALLAGIISAFVDNVATVLMVAPVALEICRKLKADPVPFIISIAVSSNLQGAATLVGDTTAIMLGSALDLRFLDFFWYQGRLSIFFAVELGACVSAVILAFLFGKHKEPVLKSRRYTKVADFVPSGLLLCTILMLILMSFAPKTWNLPGEINGMICCGMLLVGLIYNVAKKRSASGFTTPLKHIDVQTLILLLGLFMMIGGIKNMGVINELANLLARLGKENVFLLYTVIVWFSVLISAFIDNIPYVATMIPVIGSLSVQLAGGLGTDVTMVATPLYFGLLSGATLGGNCTPIGASANIAAIGILRKAGCTVKSKDFCRIGIPFTIAAIIPAYIYIWLVFGVK